MRWPTTLLFSCAAGCSVPQGSPAPASTGSGAPPPAATLTIASYNLLYALAESTGAVDAETLRTAAALDADVLVFQESNAAWEAALRPALAAHHPHCLFRAPERWAPEGLGVCARHPLGRDAKHPSAVGWFPALSVVVHTPSGPVQILDVHLRPAVANAADWWATLRQLPRDHERELESHLAALDPAVPTLVVGDFNDVPGGESFRALAATGFGTALPEAGVTGPTWRWAGTPLEAQLDHIAYESAAFEVVSAEIVAGGRSDHQPIVATLRRRR